MEELLLEVLSSPSLDVIHQELKGHLMGIRWMETKSRGVGCWAKCPLRTLSAPYVPRFHRGANGTLESGQWLP